jgi:hypothetical protein
MEAVTNKQKLLSSIKKKIQFLEKDLDKLEQTLEEEKK